jgi:hypothetical protein
MSIDAAQSKLREIIESLARTVAKESAKDKSLIEALGKASELSSALSDIDLAAMKKASSELADIRRAEEIISLTEKQQHYRIPAYIDDFIALQPGLKYPAKIPSTLFQSEKLRKVIVEVPRRKAGPDKVSIDDMMTMLFPGLLTFRYGPLMKVPVGRWSPFKNRVSPPLSAVVWTDVDKFEATKNELPPDYPAESVLSPVFVPQELTLREVGRDNFRREEELDEQPSDVEEAESTLYLRICTRCGAVQDGDETCGCGLEFLQWASPPKSYPLIWNVVDSTQEKLLAEDAFFKQIIASVSFSENTSVKKILYGFERKYKASSWRLYYDTLYGESFITDGLRFESSAELISSVLEHIKKNDPFLVRDLRLLQYLDEFWKSVQEGAYDLTFLQTFALFRALLVEGLKKCIPQTTAEVDELFGEFGKNPQVVLSGLSKLRQVTDIVIPLIDGEIADAVGKSIRKANELARDSGATESFLARMLSHSLEHCISTAAMIVLGVDDNDIRSHNSTKGNQIFVYDNLTDGNGCSETLSKLMKITSMVRVRAVRDAIERDTPVTLPSKDFYSVLEEFMSGCKAERADSLYLKLVKDPSMAKLVQASTNDSTRQQLLAQLSHRYSLDNYTLSHLDALLRYPSHHFVLSRIANEQLFVYKLVPEAFVLRLSAEDRIALTPEDVDHARAALSKVQDALEMCVDGCPVCLYTRYCESSIFLMRYVLSRRLVEHAYRIVRSRSLLDIGKAQRDQTFQKALDALQANDFVYLRANSTVLQQLLEAVFALLGQPVKDSKVVVHSLSFDFMQDEYAMKLEVER